MTSLQEALGNTITDDTSSTCNEDRSKIRIEGEPAESSDDIGQSFPVFFKNLMVRETMFCVKLLELVMFDNRQ